jgi:hypothetical protein
VVFEGWITFRGDMFRRMQVIIPMKSVLSP